MGTKVDTWSVGVILYILLCGFPPFYEEDLPALFEQIMSGRYDFPSPWWDPISEQAKDLVNCLLKVNPEERYSSAQILEHPWIKESDAVSNDHLSGTISSLRKYNASRKMKKAALGVIAARRLE